MYNYEFTSEEDLKNLSWQIGEAEKVLEIRRMDSNQLNNELQLALKKKADLEQQQAKLKDKLIQQNMMKNAELTRQEAEQKAIAAINAAFKVLNSMIDEIEKVLSKKAKSVLPKAPIKAPEHTM